MKNKKVVDKYKPPQSDSKDTAHLVAKAALSFVPGASDLFEYFVVPPMQKRLEKWQQEISQALLYLEENQGVKLEKLQDNEFFITIVAQATTIAIRTHQKEKLNSLRHAISNSAIFPNKDEDLRLVFIKYIDELTPSHLKLLSYFIQNEHSLAQVPSYTELYHFYLENNTTLPSKDEFKMECGDLINRGLVRISSSLDDFEDIYEPDVRIAHNPEKDGILPKIIVTDVAKKFIEFISSKDLEHK